jgi:protein-S-isoprenylcysteine O-methyltransferase Ste14
MRNVALALEAILFTLIVPGAVWYWIPRHVLGTWSGSVPPPWTAWHIGALAPLTIGAAVYLRCLWEFAARGRGIPTPVDHPRRLVVTGLYRYVRNPMYVGVLLVLLGEAVFFRSTSGLLYALVWLALIHLNVVFYEEPYLRRRFGGDYERYTRAVHRWLPGRPYATGH